MLLLLSRKIFLGQFQKRECEIQESIDEPLAENRYPAWLTQGGSFPKKNQDVF